MSEQILDLPAREDALAKPAALDRWARSLVRRRLAGIRRGSLTLTDADGSDRFGDRDAELRAHVRIEDPRFYRGLVSGGALAGAEAYIDGRWSSDDPTAVLRILALNPDALRGLDAGLSRWLRPPQGLARWLARNTRAGSRRNIAAHYDLGNEFFELFLDPTLTYSSGVFETPGSSMEAASIAKYDRVCRKLRLGPEDHLLEIGSGWGGMAIHAARHYGCRVTTTTISRNQYELASRRVAEAGLSQRVELLFEDYRDLRGQYDKLVSIEMIEAVGHEHLDAFLRVCGERLRPQGSLLLQAITVPDQGFEEHTRSLDFIKRYIFPGGELVSVGAVVGAAARQTDLRMTHLEDLTTHYAETLRRWRARMFENIESIRGLGLGERFLRMWEFYLCYCEAGFEERQTGLVQALFEKPEAR